MDDYCFYVNEVESRHYCNYCGRCEIISRVTYFAAIDMPLFLTPRFTVVLHLLFSYHQQTELLFAFWNNKNNVVINLYLQTIMVSQCIIFKDGFPSNYSKKQSQSCCLHDLSTYSLLISFYAVP